MLVHLLKEPPSEQMPPTVLRGHPAQTFARKAQAAGAPEAGPGGEAHGHRSLRPRGRPGERTRRPHGGPGGLGGSSPPHIARDTTPAAQPLPGRPPPAWEQSVALFRPGRFCTQEPVPGGSAGLLYAKGHGIDSTSIYT